MAPPAAQRLQGWPAASGAQTARIRMVPASAIRTISSRHRRPSISIRVGTASILEYGAARQQRRERDTALQAAAQAQAGRRRHKKVQGNQREVQQGTHEHGQQGQGQGRAAERSFRSRWCCRWHGGPRGLLRGSSGGHRRDEHHGPERHRE
eukprot:7380741-Prymnesium_polylepis.1